MARRRRERPGVLVVIFKHVANILWLSWPLACSTDRDDGIVTKCPTILENAFSEQTRLWILLVARLAGICSCPCLYSSAGVMTPWLKVIFCLQYPLCHLNHRISLYGTSRAKAIIVYVLVRPSFRSRSERLPGTPRRC